MSLAHDPSRRRFVSRAARTAAALSLVSSARLPAAADPRESAADAGAAAEPIIDIHQHTNYSGRTDAQLVEHQRRLGVTTTILLPAGSAVTRPSTHDGSSNGLAAGCGGNESVLALARRHPGAFLFFANEVVDLPGAREEVARYLRLGAVGIGEQKFNVECDADEIAGLCELAAEHGVPVLMHFQYKTYNKGYERFGKVLERFPKVNFIGHAQTFWAHVDKNYDDAAGLYPKAPVTPGGLTDRYLADYPNLYADVSAGSGLNAMMRDEDHARRFLARHQDKLLYGSDCNDRVGRGATCSGWLAIRAIRRLAPDRPAARKILHDNARRLFRL